MWVILEVIVPVVLIILMKLMMIINWFWYYSIIYYYDVLCHYLLHCVHWYWHLYLVFQADTIDDNYCIPLLSVRQYCICTIVAGHCISYRDYLFGRNMFNCCLFIIGDDIYSPNWQYCYWWRIPVLMMRGYYVWPVLILLLTLTID